MARERASERAKRADAGGAPAREIKRDNVAPPLHTRPQQWKRASTPLDDFRGGRATVLEARVVSVPGERPNGGRGGGRGAF